MRTYNQSISSKPFLVLVYTICQDGDAAHFRFTHRINATMFADAQFLRETVLKVKVWDLRKGGPFANVSVHVALVLHLV